MKNNRPVISVPPTKLIIALDVITLFILLASVVYMVTSFSALPQQIPTHFNGAGEADGFGSKNLLFILPAIGLLLFFGLTFMRKSPHSFNYPVAITEENAAQKYRLAITMVNVLKYVTTLLFAYLLWNSVRVGLGLSEGLGAWFLPVVLVSVFGTIIYFINRMAKS